MKCRFLYLAGFVLFVAAMLAGCGGRESEQLQEIAAIVDDQPELALAKLDSVKLDDLNTADRHFYDFLTIKATDKAYITHESDSLVRSVIEYYQNRPDDELLPEVLYYGGRVYSDLGDAPQALDYYQQSLDRVPDTVLELRGRIVSQMGRLYKNQYLFSQAIDRVKESIEIDKELDDAYDLAYDNSMLANIYLACNNVDSAIYYFEDALKIASESLKDEDVAIMKIYLAYGLVASEKYQDAKALIPIDLLNDVSDNMYLMALAKYIYVYGECGDIEFLKYLIDEFLKYDDDIEVKSIAYGALTEYDIATNNLDSVYKHVLLYKWATDSLNRTISQEAMNYQNCYFNYSLRERDNHQLTKEKYQRGIIIIVTTSAFIIACLVAIYFVNANKRKRLKLELAISQLRRISNDNGKMSKKLKTISDFKQELISLIHQRVSSIDESVEVGAPSEISNTSVYKELCMIVKEESQNSVKQYLHELETIIDNTYPQFKPTIAALLVTFSEHEYRICMLIKCGFTSTQIANLTCKTTSAISNSRARMSERAFGQKLGAHYWDKVVHSL